jgi:hypothetical protein
VRELRILLAAAIALAATAGAARAADVPVVAQWSRFEAAYVPDAVPANPFDPDEIDVRAEFDPPGGAPPSEVPAFWFQDYERALVAGRERLTAVGTPAFHVRFTPTRQGTWRWRWVVRAGGATVEHPWQRLRVKRARGRGFVRLSPRDARYLAFDDGSSYFAVGENTAWYTPRRGTFDYDDWLAALAAQGANYGRVWMPDWAFGIEWTPAPLGDYTTRLDRAWQLDHVFEEADRQGIYLMLSLLNHGAFSLVFNSEWADNPYNAANGGPCATPAEFFTNAEARRLFAQRLRYVVARWGWSTHLLAWELWNEVDLTLAPSPAVTAWHADMTELLRSLDPNRHLVTTSHALYPLDPNVWASGGLDFTQIHFYADNFPAQRDISATVASLTADRLAATGKPVLFGELGLGDLATTRAEDPGGIGVHDGLWAGVASGGFGTGMTWWWDSLIAGEPDLYYPMFGAVARFVDGVRWDRERFEPAGATVESARPVVAYGLAGRRTLLLWLKDDAFQWYAPAPVPIADASLTVARRWCGSWYDPWTGTWLGDVKFRDHVPVPPFSRDLALRARRC